MQEVSGSIPLTSTTDRWTPDPQSGTATTMRRAAGRDFRGGGSKPGPPHGRVPAATSVRRSPSSRGLGHRPFTAVTGVRIPVGTPPARVAAHGSEPRPRRLRRHRATVARCSPLSAAHRTIESRPCRPTPPPRSPPIDHRRAARRVQPYALRRPSLPDEPSRAHPRRSRRLMGVDAPDRSTARDPRDRLRRRRQPRPDGRTRAGGRPASASTCRRAGDRARERVRAPTSRLRNVELRRRGPARPARPEHADVRLHHRARLLLVGARRRARRPVRTRSARGSRRTASRSSATTRCPAAVCASWPGRSSVRRRATIADPVERVARDARDRAHHGRRDGAPARTAAALAVEFSRRRDATGIRDRPRRPRDGERSRSAARHRRAGGAATVSPGSATPIPSGMPPRPSATRRTPGSRTLPPDRAGARDRPHAPAALSRVAVPSRRPAGAARRCPRERLAGIFLVGRQRHGRAARAVAPRRRRGDRTPQVIRWGLLDRLVAAHPATVAVDELVDWTAAHSGPGRRVRCVGTTRSPCCCARVADRCRACLR